MTVQALEGAGIPLGELAAAIRGGLLSLAFMDAASYEKFASLSAETFQQVSQRTGIPLHLLLVIREAIGSAQPTPDDRVREDELAIVPFIEISCLLVSGRLPSSDCCAFRATACAGWPRQRPPGGTPR